MNGNSGSDFQVLGGSAEPAGSGLSRGGAQPGASGLAAGSTADIQAGQGWDFLPDALKGMAKEYESPEKFWADFTPPADAEGYALPETYDLAGVEDGIAAQVNTLMAESRAEMQKLAHAAGLSPRQAQAFYGALAPLLATSVAAQAAPVDAEKVFADVWPKDTAKNVDIARRGARSLGIGDELDAAGLSAHPLVLRMAHALGMAAGEDTLSGGGDGSALPTGDAAYREMVRLANTDAYKAREPSVVRMFEALSRRVK